MVSEESIHLHMSSHPNDLNEENMESNSKIVVNPNESQVDSEVVNGDVFVIEDLGQQKENDQVSSTVNNGGILRIQNIEVVESLSIGHLKKVDIQPDNTGENGTISEDGEIGVDEMEDGEIGVDEMEDGELGAEEMEEGELGIDEVEDGELGIDETDGTIRPSALSSKKESSLRVIYSSLPSRSKRKLEELLLQWSAWHAKNCSSTEDLDDSLESGEENYFPALHVGSDKLSTVSFSMDVHVRKRQREEAASVDQGGSSLYDRGYAIGLSLGDGVTGDVSSYDLREAPRCFNCGSYNHPLSECSKPRDNAAVNNARKQFLGKKTQNTGSRVPTRYYQESPGGKYDGLKPGVLSAETKQLLGLGDLDPPPWLHRMRELGYPPGYLDREEDQPSGITIFGDEENHNASTSNGSTSDAPKASEKMTVDFPGINAPIPENADQWRWATPRFRGPPTSDSPRDYYHSRSRNNQAHDSINNEHDGSRSWSHHNYGLGSSPPSSQHPYDAPHRNELFNPRGIESRGNARSVEQGRPRVRYDFDSF